LTIEGIDYLQRRSDMSDKRLAEISKELDSIEFRMKKLSDDVKALKVLAEKESKQMKEILSILYFLKELEDAGK
jgi:uncharacterized protein with PhoU and TrkA domain